MKIETHSGRFFDYTDPRAEDVAVEDVAHALSQIARFGGHAAIPYSVAEHALLCRRLAIEGGWPELAFAALHHDSHEAYIGDVVTPLKVELGGVYRDLADRIDAAVAEAVGIPRHELHDPVVRAVDQMALRIEAAALKRSGGIGPAWGLGDVAPPAPLHWHPGLGPRIARDRFLAAHDYEKALRS